LANHAAEHVDGLKAGQIVITGARVGPVAIEAGSVAEGSINGRASVKSRIV
jgi:2-keto-4-pentenoate hydratase